MLYINNILDYWLNTHWVLAFIIAAGVNMIIYIIAATVLEKLVFVLVEKYKVGVYISTQELKPNQKKQEFINGIIACIIFALTSLLARLLYVNLWPITVLDFIIQSIVFTLFYESYSYFIHRLLHKKPLLKFHAVHHRSIRVTPWSAYNVHPIEALFIGLSAPVFMLIFPLSLGVVLTFHVVGMVFTIFIHSNYHFKPSIIGFSKINNYSNTHSQHHSFGKGNFGFINSFWDKIFKTKI